MPHKGSSRKSSLSRRMERQEHKWFDSPMTYPEGQGPKGFLPGNKLGYKHGRKKGGPKKLEKTVAKETQARNLNGTVKPGRSPRDEAKGRPGRNPGTPALSPMLNYNTYKALQAKIKERREETDNPEYRLRDYIKETIDEVGLTEWLKVMSKYQPKEKVHTGSVNVDHQHNHRHTHEGLSETSAWITEVLGEVEDGEITESVPDRPLLPS